MDRKKLKKGAFIASLGAVALIGMTAAFLTSNDETDNRFKVANVDLSITENFDRDQTLAAGQVITKQPSVKNTGSVKQLFFVEVSVPCMETTLVDENGKRIVPTGMSGTLTAENYKQLAEIFDLLSTSETKADVTHDTDNTKYASIQYNTGGSAGGWVYLKQTESEQEYKGVNGYMDGKYNTYLFGYSTWVEPDSSTIPVFDKLRLRSMVDGDLTDKTVGQVTVRAYTIQQEDLKTSVTNQGTAESPYTDTDLTALYGIIENKEGKTNG